MPRRPKTQAEWTEARRKRWAQAFGMVERGDASDGVAMCVNLVAQGMDITDIADSTGFARSTVAQLLKDPTGEKARTRKLRQARQCVDCGGVCNTDGRTTEVAERCKGCARRHKQENAKWQPEKIVEAIKRWADTYGDAPAATDWNVGMCHGAALRAFYAGDYPHLTEVQRRFGTWNNALEAAGFERRAVGKYRRKERPFPVPAKLKPEDVIEREADKLKARREKLQQELVELDRDLQRYQAAQEILKQAA